MTLTRGGGTASVGATGVFKQAAVLGEHLLLVPVMRSALRTMELSLGIS